VEGFSALRSVGRSAFGEPAPEEGLVERAVLAGLHWIASERRRSEGSRSEISYDAEPDWHAHYNARLAKATGCRLDFLPASTCPPRDANRLWIAGFEEDDGGGHAVICRGHFIVHDPAGLYRGNVPMDRLVDGMVITPARRVIPIFSPHGRGYAVVPA
jgi:hypothetical protein